MKKILFILSIILLSMSLGLFLFIKINIKNNINDNKNVINEIKKMIDFNSYTNEINLPSVEINNENYIGVLNIPKYNLVFSVKKRCDNFVESLCGINSDKLHFKGSNLKDSVSIYKELNVNDEITFTNMLGNTYKYNIENIIRLKEIKNIDKYNNKMVLIIKDYYQMEYVVFICENSY